MKKTAQFKELLQSDQLEFICESHNGLSAKIAQEAGFKGIWASGLSLSAQFGVRDNNEASWTQVLEMLEFMSDATQVPILLDGDTGYGNFNNMRRLVNKLEQRDIAAVCIEDKLFPKTNSFIDGSAQPLADINEFSGKIKAGKDAQADDDFSIIARIEAFIAGWGLSEALKRAEAYHEAGADGILIHSALSVPDEILAFKKEWADRCPVVIVPTKYYATPTQVFRDYNFSVVIWANHLLRSSITAMQQTTKALFEEENLWSVEDSVASVKEVFRLQGSDELKDAEKRYLPDKSSETTAIILAASRGSDLGELTEDKPKTMIDISGTSILEHIVDAYREIGIKDILVVRGYKKEKIDLPNINTVDNDDYADSSELVSLEKALTYMKSDSDLIISYGDVLFNRYIPQSLLDSDESLVVAIDTNWQESVNKNRDADYVHCSAAHSRSAFGNTIKLESIGSQLSDAKTHGEWMGFVKISATVLNVVKNTLSVCIKENKQAKIPDLLNALIAKNQSVSVVYTTGHWLDIDSVEDVVSAGHF